MVTRLLQRLKVIALNWACLLAGVASAHILTGDPDHPHYDWSVQPPMTVAPAWFIVQANPATSRTQNVLTAIPPNPAKVPPQSEVFTLFSPRVMVHWDEQYLYIEDNGLPAHGMMIGITAWQQQVPLPQSYLGDNAWRLPLYPVPSQHPVSIRGRFLRGAIAIAANGIPIFNPQNNRGEISADIGELDRWGGHCGRGDDYHYHIAPLHLQSIVGIGRPIAYALDGYPIYGLAEPDGSPPGPLDEFHGHTLAGVGYHYHASTKYPFVNGGFHGEVVERNGQVDPQPHAQPIRPSTPPLRGAIITGFNASPDESHFSLQYTLDGLPASVNYASTGSGRWHFDYLNADGTAHAQDYTARDDGGRRLQRAGSPGDTDLKPGRTSPAAIANADYTPPHRGNMVLHSSAVGQDGTLPVEFTGDGTGVSPPLDWSGEPAGTKYFAVIMHHIPGPGDVKWYWTLYNIPANVHALAKNTRGIGTLGNNSVNNELGYAPPHSKGPGPKVYTLTLYALSAPLQINLPAEEVSRAVLLAAMRTNLLDSAELKVVCDRTKFIRRHGGGDAPDESGRPPQNDPSLEAK